MKRLLALVLLVGLFLSACTPALSPNEEKMTESTKTQSNTQEDIKKEEDKTLFLDDPQEDDTLNVFFVSNSTCYYFTDELYGLLAATGKSDVKLCLAYISGCSLQKHYEGYRLKRSDYQYRILSKDGLEVINNQSLADCLASENWDVISFDNNARSYASGEVQTSIDNAEPYFGLLLKDLREKFPKARFLWHQVWANEIGYNMAFKMESKEQRDKIYLAKLGVTNYVTSTYGIGAVPCGRAWEKVRDLPLFTSPLPAFPEAERFSLCSRIASGEFKDDYTHDGDIGGGQYLNACVWFEILTGESCIGNPFRPTYTYKGKDVSLTEEKIQILQNAAHEAVEAYKNS